MNIIYRTAKKTDVTEMAKLWNIEANRRGFYKPIEEKKYQEKMESDPNINYDNVYLAFDDEKLVAFLIVIYRSGNLETAYLNAILTLSEYRKMGIMNHLLSVAEDDIRSKGYKKIVATNFLPSCYSWFIPGEGSDDHPCAPGLSINSSEYLFYLHHGYEAFAYQDAFHLNLSDYELSPKIKEILEENKKDNILIELYDPSKHYGIDEFCKELNIYDFEKVIKENLALEKPYPFLVVAKDNRVVGWTGAMWNEESGRGHFDGIAILEEVRGRGLGKALFSSLAYYSKMNGAKFMTFYTGLTNHARYIYMGAGFKIRQSFCAMKKELK